MTKTVRVTSAQVRAAQTVVRRAQESGTEPSPAILKIADAKPADDHRHIAVWGLRDSDKASSETSTGVDKVHTPQDHDVWLEAQHMMASRPTTADEESALVKLFAPTDFKLYGKCVVVMDSVDLPDGGKWLKETVEQAVGNSPTNVIVLTSVADSELHSGETVRYGVPLNGSSSEAEQ